LLWATYDLFGFRSLKVEKSSEWSVSSAPFVGTVTDFSLLRSDGLISVSIKPETRAKALAMVDEVLRSNELTPARSPALCTASCVGCSASAASPSGLCAT